MLEHAAELGLELRPEKCKVYIPPLPSTTGARSDIAYEAIVAECAARGLTHVSTVESLGVMFGDDDSIEQHCEATVEDSHSFLAALTHAEMPTQGHSISVQFMLKGSSTTYAAAHRLCI